MRAHAGSMPISYMCYTASMAYLVCATQGMADIEELGGLLVGEEVQWGEEALCFLDYAHDADQALTAAQIM